ncbi:hypothetical protein DICVIV_06303 [Dictyocaulus viviparus]|uniref:Uncharacterized protein n=1 Tax=Dictyocaulus viviparus TaxID=29172 RepID=A0A0D8XZ13_DICVI|nr:hypothetical protein DICVIV_06303 [Dictyocaulus viviparus]
MEVAIDLRPILGQSPVRLDPMRIKQLHFPSRCSISQTMVNEELKRIASRPRYNQLSGFVGESASSIPDRLQWHQ